MNADQRLKVVIAEDEYLELMGFKQLVEEMGHQVIGEASDGLQATRLVGELHPDLVLMDINLPSLDGISAADRINRETKVPVIIITGYARRSFIEKAATNTGIYGFLVKPVDGKDLAAAIPIALARFAEMNQVEQSLALAKRELEERKVVERAKGILMERLNMTEPAAMHELQRRSRNSNRKLALVAMDIIAAEEVLSSQVHRVGGTPKPGRKNNSVGRIPENGSELI